MTMDKPVDFSLADGIATITLNRIETRNAISDADMVDGLIALLQRADDDPEVRVVVLTGAGTSFSSGGNLKEMRDGKSLRDALPARTRTNYRSGIQRIPLTFQTLEIPVIAAVNGPAIGAGCDLACMCDIRIAGESARFAESFVKLGIIPGDGGAWFLQRLIGYSKAFELSVTGDVIDAANALKIGLVHKVTSDDTLMAEAYDLARRIAANPPLAVRMTKRLMRDAASLSLGATLEMSAALQALAHETGDHSEAMNAFLEKRKGDFKGE